MTVRISCTLGERVRELDFALVITDQSGARVIDDACSDWQGGRGCRASPGPTSSALRFRPSSPPASTASRSGRAPSSRRWSNGRSSRCASPLSRTIARSGASGWGRSASDRLGCSSSSPSVSGPALTRSTMAAAESGISAVVPTIGRPALLRRCLDSLAACDPPPAEVLVVDQSPGPTVEQVVAGFSGLGARTVRSSGRGIAKAQNDGIAAAASEFIVVTHDDCTVSPTGSRWPAPLGSGPGGGLHGTGSAPAGSGQVPSTIDRPAPILYSGRQNRSPLPEQHGLRPRGSARVRRLRPPAHAVGRGQRLLLPLAASRAAAALRAGPRVWHHDWRTPEQLKTVPRIRRGSGRFLRQAPSPW